MIIQQAKLMLLFFLFLFCVFVFVCFFLHMYHVPCDNVFYTWHFVFHCISYFSSQFLVCVHLCGCEFICITLHLYMYNA